MSFTVIELQDAITKMVESDSYNGEGHFGYEIEYLESHGDKPNETIELEDIGTIEFVESVGGEGQGDHMHVVFKIGERYFKLDGFYSSWDGSEWGDISEIYEVKPKEVKVVQYERV